VLVCSLMSHDVRVGSGISCSDEATDKVSRSDEMADSVTSGCHDTGCLPSGLTLDLPDSSVRVVFASAVVPDGTRHLCLRDLGFLMIAPLVAIGPRNTRPAGDLLDGGIGEERCSAVRAAAVVESAGRVVEAVPLPLSPTQ